MALFGKKKPTPKKQTPDELALVAEEKVTLEEERIYRRGAVSIRDLIAPAAFEVNPSFIRLGDLYAATVFVVTYPRYVSVGWSYPIISMNRSLDVSMFFYPVKAEVILKQLKNKVGALEAQIIMDAEKGAARDPLRETALRDIEKLRDDLTQGVEHFFQYAFYVTAYAHTTDDLDKIVEEIDSVFGAKLIFSKRVFYQSEQGFNSCLPLGNDELQITFNMNSSPIASSFPFICADLTSNSGVLYGLNKHNSSLIVFDRFSMQNPNMVVFATSGAGKSFAVKLEILRSLMLGTDVIVIDPEMEYKHLSDAVGGTYMNISLSSDSKINPFDLPRPMDQSQTAEDIIRSAVITVKGLLRIMLGTITTAEDSILDRALLEAYAKKDIVPGINPLELGQYEPPILQDFEEVLSGMTGSSDLVERLKKYTEGTFAGLLNSPTTVDMKNQFVIFSVRDLEDELRPMAIYTIVSYIWNVVRSVSKKRILVIDEAWWLMQHEDSAKFIFALVKRCRKYYLGVTTITQDVNDFLTSAYGQAIINNSAIQLLLKQSPAAIDLIQKTFLLTDTEKYLLLESDVGNGIFFAGSSHVGIQVIASYTEEQLITTDPQQLLEIEEEKKRFAEENAVEALQAQQANQVNQAGQAQQTQQ
jgi:conjugal transfer ATP-binding protein TraC